MKKNRSFGNSLLLAIPLVASFNLGISSNAATISSSGIEPSEETIYRGNEFVISVNQQMSERQDFLIQDLLQSTADNIDNSRSTFGNDLISMLGDVSLGINDFFAPNIESEFTPLTPVNNFRSERANSYEINSIYSSEDPLRVLLKSFQSRQDSQPEKNQSQIASDTDSIQPIEINQTPTSEDIVVKEPAQNNTVKVPQNTSRESEEPLTTETRRKIAQLPKAVSIDKEVKSLFDPLQIIGGAIALGFLVWMLLQE
jgi:hypothetical protein